MTTNQVRAGRITRTDRLCLSANFLRIIATDIIIDRPARLDRYRQKKQYSVNSGYSSRVIDAPLKKQSCQSVMFSRAKIIDKGTVNHDQHQAAYLSISCTVV